MRKLCYSHIKEHFVVIFLGVNTMSLENAVEMDNDSTDAEYVPEEDDDDSEIDTVRKPEKNTNHEEEINIEHTSASNRAFLSNPLERKPKLRNTIWNLFTPVDVRKKIARCNLCDRGINFSTVSNLKTHFIRFHVKSSTNEELELSPNSVVKRKKSVRVIDESRRGLRSVVWKYYDKVDGEKKLARCHICCNAFSYRGTVSNLKRHLIGKHKIEPKDSSDEEDQPEVPEEEYSAVWLYFKCLSQDLKLASCLICKKRLDYTDEHDLTEHLSRKHPKAHAELQTSNKTKKLLITNNGDIYEIDNEVAKREPDAEQSNDNYSHEYNNEIDALATPEYLDEDIFNESRNVPAKKLRKTVKEVPTIIKDNNRYVKLSETSSIVKETEEERSLNIFGKYIVSLLRRLPIYKSDQLQADFIRQIMDAQIKDSQNISTGINTKHISSTLNSVKNDVTSNGDVQRVITSDGEIGDVVVGN